MCIRDSMEHRYSCPDREVIEDFVDVVGLFLQATARYIDDRRCQIEFEDSYTHVNVSIVLRGEELIVGPCGHRASPWFRIPASDKDNYCRLLNAALRHS